MKKSLLIAASLWTGVAAAAPVFNPATGHWYDIVQGATNPGIGWNQAEAASVALGGHLVTINDAAENAWIINTFGRTEQFWIGLNDVALEGTFVWTSGEAVTYTNWNPGEPNNFGGNEDHAVINWAPGTWNDCQEFVLCGQQFGTGLYRGIAEWAPARVPEPASLALLGLGLAGLGFVRKRG